MFNFSSDENNTPSDMDRKDIYIALSLGAVVVLTRIPFLEATWFCSDFRFLLDGVLYKGVAHPPGYIGYVWAAKALVPVAGSPHAAIILLNLLSTFLLAATIYLFTLRMPSATRSSGAIVTILYLCNPYVWYYGEVSLSYISEALMSVVTGYFCFEVLRGKRWATFASAVALAIGASLRQTLLFFVAPLWLAVHIRSYWPWPFVGRNDKPAKSSLLLLFAGVAIIVPIVAFWMYYTIVFYEPLGGYGEQFGSIMKEAVWANSIFVKGLRSLMKNGAKLIFNICWGMNAALLLYLMKPTRERIKKLWMEDREMVTFLLVWLLPSFTFYLFIFMGPPGYIFVFLPVFYLPLAGGLSGKTARWAVIAALVSAVLFLIPRPLDDGLRNKRLLNVMLLKYNATGIRMQYSRNLLNLDSSMPRDYGGDPKYYKK